MDPRPPFPAPPPTPGGLSADARAELRHLLAGLDRLAAVLGLPDCPGDDGDVPLARYRLRRKIGEGRFGVVLLADDPELRRAVVVKVPQPAVLPDPGLRGRFVREARAAARLDHPDVVPVLDAGEDGGLPYLVAGHVDGPTLAAWLAARPARPDPATAARFVARVARAVQHAHDRGVLHCDLKPSNILVDRAAADAVPGVGAPRVTDFGLARVLDDDPTLTRTLQVAGTPLYMAPEQARGDRRGLTARADVYAVGAVLYELLTGRPPFAGGSDAEVLARLLGEMPERPRRVSPSVPRDLEAVCLKCLGKDPADRYPTAAALADDLGRFLAGEPTAARPARWPERAERWAVRNPAVAALGLGLVAAAGAVGVLAAREYTNTRTLNADLETALGRERAVAADLREVRYVDQVRLADQLGRVGRDAGMCDLLSGLYPAPGEADRRDFAWHYLWRRARPRLALSGHRGWVRGVAVSADGRLLATANGATVLVREEVTGRQVVALDCAPAGHVVVVWRADGTLAAAELRRPEGVRVQMWDVPAGRRVAEGVVPLRELGVGNRWAQGLDVGPGGAVVCAGEHRDGGAGVATWDPATGAVLDVRHEGGSYCAVRASPDGRTLALSRRVRPGAEGGEILLAPAGRPAEQTRLADTPRPAHALDFSPDGRRLAAGAPDATATVWAVDPPRPVWADRPSGEPAETGVAWAAGGAELAVVRCPEKGNSTLTRYAADGRRLEATRLPVGPGTVARSRDARRLYLGYFEGAVRYWGEAVPPPADDLAGHPAEVWAVAFSPDGRTLATGADDAAIKLWDVPSGREVATLRGHAGLVMSVAFAPDGTLISGGWDGTVRVWDVAGRREVAGWAAHDKPVGTVAVSPDGRLIAARSRAGAVAVWDAASRRPLAAVPGGTGTGGDLTFAGGGSLVAAARFDAVNLLDPVTGAVRGRVSCTGTVQSVAASADGRYLATGDNEGQITLWELPSGRLVRSWPSWGQPLEVRCLTFDPAGRVLASGGLDGSVRLWHVGTGQPLLELAGHRDKVYCVRFSPDGRTLATCCHDGSVKLWRGE